MTERCEDCARSRPQGEMVGWLVCDQKPAYVYLSAPLAVCTFEPSRFAQKRDNLGAAKDSEGAVT